MSKLKWPRDLPAPGSPWCVWSRPSTPSGVPAEANRLLGTFATHREAGAFLEAAVRQYPGHVLTLGREPRRSRKGRGKKRSS